MNRKSLLRQTAFDTPTSETKSRKPRRTADLVALNFSTCDESKSATKSVRKTAKKVNNSNVDLPAIKAEFSTRRIVRARRKLKNDNNNGKSAKTQENFDKMHDIVDKAFDKYFEFQPEYDEDKENKDDNDREERNHMEKSYKKQQNSFNVNDTSNGIVTKQPEINHKKRHTIHIVKSPNSTQIKSSKKRRTVHQLNTTFSMDEDETIEQPPKKRRTYELDSTVNNVEDLKKLEKDNTLSKLRKASFEFEDIPVTEELRPSTDDRRATFDILPLSTVKNNINQSKSDSIIDLCESNSISYENDTLSTRSPINKRLNFSNLSSRNVTKVQDDSIIVLDDTVIADVTNHKISNYSEMAKDESVAKKVSIFKTPYKKVSESQAGFTMSTPFVGNSSESSANKSTTNPKINTNSTNRSITKPRKVPNFALLHQKAFSEMEDIVEYEKRKNERAKYLLSGHKPKSVDSFIDKQSINTSTKTKKLLRFAAGFDEKEQPPNYIPLPTTPMPKNWKNFKIEESPTSDENVADKTMKVATPKPKTTTPKPANNRFKAGPSTPKPNVAISQSKTINPFNIKKSTPKPTSVTVNNGFNFKLNVANNPFNIKAPTPKATVPVRGNINRFGFKIVDLPKPSRKEEIKATVLTKAKVTKNPTGNRRDFIKGVRSNRRFDLLMKMRINN